MSSSSVTNDRVSVRLRLQRLAQLQSAQTQSAQAPSTRTRSGQIRSSQTPSAQAEPAQTPTRRTRSATTQPATMSTLSETAAKTCQPFATKLAEYTASMEKLTSIIMDRTALAAEAKPLNDREVLAQLTKLSRDNAELQAMHDAILDNADAKTRPALKKELKQNMDIEKAMVMSRTLGNVALEMMKRLNKLG